MPSIVNIPHQYKDGFVRLYLLNDDQFSSMIDSLRLTSLSSSIKKLTAFVGGEDPHKQELVKDIFLSVGSLTPFIEKNITIEEISDDIYNILAKDLLDEEDDDDYDDINGDEDKNSYDEEEREEHKKLTEFNLESGKSIFIGRLVTLLRTERLYYAAKAQDLLFEYQNVFIQARTISDIRPVYGLNLDAQPKAALIIHNLHIHYRCEQEGPHKDIYLALDSEDLRKLKDALIRAEQKEQNLKVILENSKMITLNE